MESYPNLKLSGIISPVQQRLALPAPAVLVTGRAVLLDLGDMACHGQPAFDLAFVVCTAPAHVVAAIPLEPTARIIGMDPAFGAPVA